MSLELKIISVNVARPSLVRWKGQSVSTGIFKKPAVGRIKLGRLNLDGDRQADLSVHGGPYKAVYAYSAHHYQFWRGELPEMELPFGMFGENFTVEGAEESLLNIGDQFEVGTARVMITQPRLPCYKLGIKFGRADIIKRFLASGRTGFYFSVLQEGEVEAGDTLKLIERDEHNNITVADIVRLYTSGKGDMDTMRRAIEVEALPKDWRDHFRQQFEKARS